MTAFEWDEAQTVFFDDEAIECDDPDHSEDDARFLMLGMSMHSRILVVCHCCRESSDVIRIISARRVTAKERRAYGSR